MLTVDPIGDDWDELERKAAKCKQSYHFRYVGNTKMILRWQLILSVLTAEEKRTQILKMTALKRRNLPLMGRAKVADENWLMSSVSVS